MRIGFPFPLSIGTDICSIARIQKVYFNSDERKRLLFLKKFLVPTEIELFRQRFLEKRAISDPVKASFWLAGRWAAKEAAKKAWNARCVGFHDLRVEVTGSPPGPTQIICKPLYSQQDSLEQVAQLSISHDGSSEGGYAIATVVATPLNENLLAELEDQREVLQDTTSPTAAPEFESAKDRNTEPTERQSSPRKLVRRLSKVVPTESPQDSSSTSNAKPRYTPHPLNPREIAFEKYARRLGKSSETNPPLNRPGSVSGTHNETSDPSARYF